MPPGPGEPLAQPQVGPGAGGDRRPAVQQQAQLLVVQVHGVAEHQPGTEHAEAGQVGDGAQPGAGGVGDHVVGTGRQVPGQLGAGPLGELGGPGEQLIAGQVVAHQGHPGAHHAVRGQRRQQLLVGGEHLGDGGGEGQPRGVPAPPAHAGPDADRGQAAGHRVRVGDGARLGDGRDPAEQAVHRGHHGRGLVVPAVVDAVHGHGPVEDRPLGVQRVGDGAADQRVAGGVLVGVDEPGDDDAAGRVELGGAGVGGPEVRGVAQGEDGAVGHGHGRPRVHGPVGAHGHHVAVGDEQDGGHGRTSTRPTVDRSASWSCAAAVSASGCSAATRATPPPVQNARSAAAMSAAV
ncbi:unannotated protein [freshwater metagenome]|uniref:Unannotated protein n=1 Tax=freshwater metagenome TaxID=449393 RepID=A0A6J7G4H4_9ZZZZ